MTPMPPAAPAPQLWVARFGDELYRYALGRVADEAAAEELVQDTFVSALEALASFRGQASERTWLFVILKRKLIDHYRRLARSPFVPLALGAEPDAAEALEAPETSEAEFFRPADGHWRDDRLPTAWAVGDDAPGGDLALEQVEFRNILLACQQRLPARHLAVFVLRFVEEASAEEICQALGLSTANYWVIVHRAKLHLRRCLEKNWFQAPAVSAV